MDGEHVIFGEVLDGKDVILSMETLGAPIFEINVAGWLIKLEVSF